VNRVALGLLSSDLFGDILWQMPPKLVWIETQSFAGFGCSDCQWVYKTTGAPVGRSLDQMKKSYKAERDKAFAAHDCSKFPRTNKPNK
jgi:hypothetical protein